MYRSLFGFSTSFEATCVLFVFFECSGDLEPETFDVAFLRRSSSSSMMGGRVGESSGGITRGDFTFFAAAGFSDLPFGVGRSLADCSSFFGALAGFFGASDAPKEICRGERSGGTLALVPEEECKGESSGGTVGLVPEEGVCVLMGVDFELPPDSAREPFKELARGRALGDPFCAELMAALSMLRPLMAEEAPVPALPSPLSGMPFVVDGVSFLRSASALSRGTLSFCPRGFSPGVPLTSVLLRFAGRGISSSSDPRFFAGDGLEGRAGGGFGGNELGLRVGRLARSSIAMNRDTGRCLSTVHDKPPWNELELTDLETGDLSSQEPGTP